MLNCILTFCVFLNGLHANNLITNRNNSASIKKMNLKRLKSRVTKGQFVCLPNNLYHLIRKFEMFTVENKLELEGLGKTG